MRGVVGVGVEGVVVGGEESGGEGVDERYRRSPDSDLSTMMVRPRRLGGTGASAGLNLESLGCVVGVWLRTRDCDGPAGPRTGAGLGGVGERADLVVVDADVDETSSN